MIDNTKIKYGKILESINNKDVTSIYLTFSECKNTLSSPVIPASVQNMVGAFMGCYRLENAPDLSMCAELLNLELAFYLCPKITVAPKIPQNVTNMKDTFLRCYALSGTIEIDANPIIYEGCLSETGIVSVSGKTNLKSEILATKN